MEILLLNIVSVIPYSIIKIIWLRGEHWILVLVKTLNKFCKHVISNSLDLSFFILEMMQLVIKKKASCDYSSVYLFSKCRPIIFFENEKNHTFSRSYLLIIKNKLIFFWCKAAKHNQMILQKILFPFHLCFPKHLIASTQQ